MPCWLGSCWLGSCWLGSCRLGTCKLAGKLKGIYLLKHQHRIPIDRTTISVSDNCYTEATCQNPLAAELRHVDPPKLCLLRR